MRERYPGADDEGFQTFENKPLARMVAKYDVKKARIAPAWKVRSFSLRGQRTVRP